MNLEESDSYAEILEKTNRKKKMVMMSIILCAFLIALMFILIVVLRYQDSITLKLYVDKVQKTIPKNFYFVSDNGDHYVNVREFAKLLGYTYSEGSYEKFNQDENCCFITSDFQILSLHADENIFRVYNYLAETAAVAGLDDSKNKLETQLDKDYYEAFYTKTPVIMKDGLLYVNENDLGKMFSCSYTWQEYRIRFTSYEKILKDTVAELLSDGIVPSARIENLRALADGYAVFINDAGNYGVKRLEDNKDVLTDRYSSITYRKNTAEFVVNTSAGTVGLCDLQGKPLIDMNSYNSIELLDKELFVNKPEETLYLVTMSDGGADSQANVKYGVLNRKGEEIIYPQYDAIGYDTSGFNQPEVVSDYLLLNKCIPVFDGENYALYNMEHPKTPVEFGSDFIFKSLGYSSANKFKQAGAEQSLLIIPPSVGIEGIVVSNGEYYGVYDINVGNLVMPVSFSKIYSITSAGQTEYYYEFGGVTKTVRSYLEEWGLVNIEQEETETKDASTENTQGEAVDNTVVSNTTVAE